MWKSLEKKDRIFNQSRTNLHGTKTIDRRKRSEWISQTSLHIAIPCIVLLTIPSIHTSINLAIICFNPALSTLFGKAPSGSETLTHFRRSVLCRNNHSQSWRRRLRTAGGVGWLRLPAVGWLSSSRGLSGAVALFTSPSSMLTGWRGHKRHGLSRSGWPSGIWAVCYHLIFHSNVTFVSI